MTSPGRSGMLASDPKVQYVVPRNIMQRLGRGDRSELATWFWQLDRVLLGLIFTLMVIGVFAVASASPATARKLSTSEIKLDQMYFLYLHLRWLAIGIIVMMLVSMLPKDKARQASILGCGVFLLLLFLVPIFGSETKGSARWIWVGMDLQPSEFLKPYFAVTVAWILSWKLRDPELPVRTYSLILMGIIALLLLRQPDLGQTVVVFGIWFVLILMSGLSPLIISSVLCGGILLLAGAYFFLPHATLRINGFFSEPDPYDQVAKAYDALTSSGFIGTGPGLGKAKFAFAEAHNDYIFSVIGEEFGLLACVGIIIIFLAVVVRVFTRLMGERDLFTLLAAAGLTAQICGQAMINIGVNLRMLPSKGMTLPFISYGGSSMIALCIAAGLLLSFTSRNPFLDKSQFNQNPKYKQNKAGL